MTYDLSNFHKRLLSGITREAQLLGRKLEILPVNKTNKKADYDWDVVHSIPVGAQVLVPTVWYKDIFEELVQKKCEVVIITRGIWLEEEYKKYIRNWYKIEIDRKTGTETALLHLAKNGRKRPLLIYEYEEKLHPITEGYKSGIQRAGLNFDKKLMLNESGQDKELISGTIKDHSRINFDSIILSSQYSVRQVLHELKDSGLRIPDDVAVLCLENDLLLTETEVPVSTIASPWVESGREAVRIFNRDVFLPGETRLRQTLIERESTRKGAGNDIDPEYLPESVLEDDFNKIFNM
jgi:DNA-binding LacI/PurR family transcriptional regulator